MFEEPFWYQDCVEINDCSKCPWNSRDVNELKRCEQDIQEMQNQEE